MRHQCIDGNLLGLSRRATSMAFQALLPVCSLPAGRRTVSSTVLQYVPLVLNQNYFFLCVIYPRRPTSLTTELILPGFCRNWL